MYTTTHMLLVHVHVHVPANGILRGRRPVPECEFGGQSQIQTSQLQE
jgi:hypothetical protein